MNIGDRVQTYWGLTGTIIDTCGVSGGSPNYLIRMDASAYTTEGQEICYRSEHLTVIEGSSPEPEPPTGDTTMIECNTPTPHYPSGCALLKHYDADGDGIVRSVDALIAQGDGMTSEEVAFIMTASTRGSINAMCPGCYSPAAPSKSAWLWLGAALIGLYLYLTKK